MALLCGQCHDQVTRGIWSKERVAQARQNPICKQQGFSKVGLDVTAREKFIIKVGHTEFLNLGPVIRIDGEEILTISPPEEPSTPPIISAKFFDRDNNEIAAIIENEWRGSSQAFDIETKANHISIRSGDRKIDLILTLQPPTMLIVEKMNMRYGDTTIAGTSNDGFTVTTKTAQLKVPSDPDRIERAPLLGFMQCRSNISR